ncbi:hypothetical protein BJV77DRAFT_964328 [Russula vinacea]|nr:hypothetical protein BJV77DRAFT_964328 [Russula vinacea]
MVVAEDSISVACSCRWEKWRDKERSECTDTCTGVSQPPACAKFYIAWSSSDARNCVICRVSQRIIFWKADEVVEELKPWNGVVQDTVGEHEPEYAVFRLRTKKDLASHPLLSSIQSCDSPEAILTVLREQIPAFSQSQNDDNRLTKWVTPTVNVLYSFSAALGQGVGLVNIKNFLCIPTGKLSQTAKDSSFSRDKLVDIFNRIERFFHRLEIYTGIMPTIAMRDIIIKIMVEVLTILGIVTREMKRGRLKRYSRS